MPASVSPSLADPSISDDHDWHEPRHNKLRTANSETSCTGRYPDCEGTEQLPYGGNVPNKVDARQIAIEVHKDKGPGLLESIFVPIDGGIINFNELKLTDGLSRLILPGSNMT